MEAMRNGTMPRQTSRHDARSDARRARAALRSNSKLATRKRPWPGRSLTNKL